ncbi:MAG: hypothetical protein H7336_05250 [Bacteriovorax sp.]|nr:hypothetical protein [Bacteriovorax sp.]
MKKNYFLTVAVIGLISVVFVTYAIFSFSFVNLLSIKVNAYEKFNGLVPVLAGMLIPAAAGVYFDRTSANAHWFPRIFIFPVLIFLSGVVVGVGTNFLVNGLNSSDPMAYLTSPALALTLYGVPCAMLVGIICFAIYSIKVRST